MKMPSLGFIQFNIIFSKIFNENTDKEIRQENTVQLYPVLKLLTVKFFCKAEISI